MSASLCLKHIKTRMKSMMTDSLVELLNRTTFFNSDVWLGCVFHALIMTPRSYSEYGSDGIENSLYAAQHAQYKESVKCKSEFCAEKVIVTTTTGFGPAARVCT